MSIQSKCRRNDCYQTFCTSTMTETAGSILANSSTVIMADMKLIPLPSYFSGISMPNKP